VVLFASTVTQVFNAATGEFRGAFGQKGDQAGDFEGPNDIVVDGSRETVYVVDNVRHNLQEFVGWASL
jgi:hypothetical protein